MMQQKSNHPHTLLAQADHFIDGGSGAITPPIQPATTYARGADYAPLHPGHVYSRDDNPGYRPVERLLAQLEGGCDALLFASGMAAIAALVGAVAPRRLLVQRQIYYGTRHWISQHAQRFGLVVDWFDAAEPNAVARAIVSGTDLVWIETPANPTWEVVDIAAAARAAHAVGARLAVDSTAATPLITQPLALGADWVVHSATKYLNGHSDLLAGAIIAKADDEPWRRIRAERHDAGALLGPFEAWLLLRGMRTLALRLERASANALAIAHWLEGRAEIERVRYPGLASHPQHALAVEQMGGLFGGMLSFHVVGNEAAALRFIAALQLIVPATSLGGVETLIEHRATIEGAGSGVPANLLRLSVGIEQLDDLLMDLDRGLAAVEAGAEGQ